MKKIRRCKLCGAKLNGDICSECGYNNAAYHYGAGKEDEYCTHSSSEQFFDQEDHWKHMDPDIGSDVGEHAASQEKKSVPNEETVTYGRNEDHREKKKSGKRTLIWVILLLWGIPLAAQLLPGAIRYVYQQSHPVSEWWMTDEAEVTERAMDADDRDDADEEKQMIVYADEEEFAAKLHQGIYVAGIQLPFGTYDMSVESGRGVIRVQNLRESYWKSQYFYEEESEEDTLENVELTEGTIVYIDGDLAVEAMTDAGEGYLEKTKNTEKKSAQVEDGMIVGRDLPAGTYRVLCTDADGTGNLVFKYTGGYGEENVEMIELSEENGEFQNLILSDGDVLMTLNCSVTLEPAEYDLSDFAEDVVY